MTGAHRVARILVVASLAAVAAAMFVHDALLVRVMTDTLGGNDFGKFYYSARAFLDGHDMYAPSPSTELPVEVLRGLQFLNMNPPHFHLAILPLARLPLAAAVDIWMAAGVFCLVVSLLLVAREVGFRWTPAMGLLGLAAALSFAGTRAVLVTGQLTFLLLLPTTAAWMMARRDRWTAAGAIVGLLLSVKPFFLIFLPYLLMKRHWKAAAAAVVAAAGAYGAGLAVFGLHAHIDWYRALGQSGNWAWATMNASALGLVARTFEASPYFTPLAVRPCVVRWWIVPAGVVALATFGAIWRRRHRPSVDREVALLLVGAQLVSPLGWSYYLWLPIGAVAAWMATWDGARGWRTAPCGALLALTVVGLWWPNELTVVGQPAGWASLTIGSSYFWGTAALWLLLLTTRTGHSAPDAQDFVAIEAQSGIVSATSGEESRRYRALFSLLHRIPAWLVERIRPILFGLLPFTRWRIGGEWLAASAKRPWCDRGSISRDDRLPIASRKVVFRP